MNALAPFSRFSETSLLATVHRRDAARGWVAAMVADGFVFALPPGSDPANPNAYDLRRDGIDRSADLLAAIGAGEGGRHG